MEKGVLALSLIFLLILEAEGSAGVSTGHRLRPHLQIQEEIHVLSTMERRSTVAFLLVVLAVLTVTTSEGQRLLPIRDALTEGWVSGEARVAVEHLPYIEHWDTICYELLRAHKNGVWDGPFTELLRVHTNIKSKEDALAVVGVIANRTLQGVLMAHARRA